MRSLNRHITINQRLATYNGGNSEYNRHDRKLPTIDHVPTVDCSKAMKNSD